MIPILFEKDTTTFTTQGLGRLPDCISCIVAEERNGIYECQFQYPITGVMYKELQLGRIIVCTHDDRKDLQPFVIYQRSIPDVRGIVTFNAHHISYKLNDIVVMPFTADSVAQALDDIRTNSANTNPFTFWTDKSTVADFKSDEPRLARNMLGGEENSILDVFGGGEYEFDKFEVKLYAHRGQDSGVEIRYAKNLIDFKQDIDDSGCYNAVVPFWKNTEGDLVTLPEKILFFGQAGETVDAAPMDLSSDFENAPTASELRTRATSKYQSGGSWNPKDNITVDFVQLWQTEEYKNFTGLQRVSLCDTVSVFYEPAGVEAVKQKVVKVAYNVLLERYDQIELGELQTSLGQAIRENILEEVPTNSMMEEAIQYATELIRGGLGGYVVMTPGQHGYPQEILIMDTPDVNTAVNVWRFNRGGLGHSHNGYNGPYSDIALTADGKINATMITTGILNANIIRAGVLQDVNGNTSFNLSTGLFTMKRGSINLGNGKFIATDAGKLTVIGGGLIRDPNSNTVFNLDTGELAINKGSINLGSGNFVVTDAGAITAKSGKIGPFTIGDSGLTYQTTVRNVGLTDSNIYYKSSYNDGSRRGVYLDAGKIAFQRRGDTSSWTLSDIVALRLASYSGNVWGLGIDLSGSEMFSLSPRTASDYGGFELYGGAIISKDLTVYDDISAQKDVDVFGNLRVSGTKNRQCKTENYSDRLLYCYETPTPLFGDIGEAVLDEDGICYVDIDDIFSETIADKVEYQVFLQAEGEGSCYIAEKTPRYFVIKGTPMLKVAWEVKAKQKDYENIRLEQSDNGLDEYAEPIDQLEDIETYITEQEALLYGYN